MFYAKQFAYVFYYIDMLASYLHYPSYIFLDEVFSAYCSTTEELKQPWKRCFHYFLIGPLCLLFFLIFLPFAIIGLLLATTYQSFRHPYIFVTNEKEATGSYVHLKKTYAFATANVCLAPEFISRMNNLSHNTKRAKLIGQNIINNQINAARKDQTMTNDVNQSNERNEYSLKSPAKTEHIRQRKKQDFNHEILTQFPLLDFLFLQETFDKKCAKIITQELLKIFPYVVYDCTVNSFSSNIWAFNSGLAFASKYPILKLDFKYYPDSWSQCWLASKGLLMAKVKLGEQSGKPVVGYLACSHLQAYQNKRRIIYKQLTNIVSWLAEFKEKNARDNEIMAFDILGGDFNFDNMSPSDTHCAEHPIFDQYIDLGRVRPGKDHDWTVGTEFRQLLLFDSCVRDPKSLKNCLLDSSQRQYYVNNADIKSQTLRNLAWSFSELDEHGRPVLKPEGGKRRIDYIFYRKNKMVVGTTLRQVTMFTPTASDPSSFKSALGDPTMLPLYVVNADRTCTYPGMHFELPPMDENGKCITSPVGGKRRIDYMLYRKNLLSRPVSFNAVTQLATLTDHLPISLTLEVNLSEKEEDTSS